MAPTFRHGRNAHFWLDSTAGSLVDLSSGISDLTISRSMDPAETSVFGNNGNKTYVPGMRGATISFSGMFSSTHAEVLDGIFSDATSTTYSFELTPDGATSAGRHLLKGECIPTAVDYSMSVGDMVGMSVTLQVTGSVTSTNH